MVELRFEHKYIHLLSTLLLGLWRRAYWTGLPFPSPVDHTVSDLSTITHLSWVALHHIARSFTELHKAVIHMIILVSFL